MASADPPWAKGQVVDTSPLLVQLRGSDDASEAELISGYTAVLNDYVLCAFVDGGIIIIGKIL